MAAAKRKVREDFEGVIHIPDHGLVLKAGDEIPAGVEVGDHVLKSPTPAAESDNE